MADREEQREVGCYARRREVGCNALGRREVGCNALERREVGYYAHCGMAPHFRDSPLKPPLYLPPPAATKR